MAFDNVERAEQGELPLRRAPGLSGLVEPPDDFHNRGGDCDARIVVAHDFVHYRIISVPGVTVNHDGSSGVFTNAAASRFVF